MENVALWHERDISHSSVERMIGPDATVTLDFALNRLAGVVDKLVVYPENMQKNLDRLGGLVHSQRVLIALTQKGVAREDAYRIVQDNAMKVWRGEGDFLTFLKDDPRVTAKMSTAEIEENFDLGYHFKRHDLPARVRHDRKLTVLARQKSPAGCEAFSTPYRVFTRLRIFWRTCGSFCATWMIVLYSSTDSPWSVTALASSVLASLASFSCSAAGAADSFCS
jgi:hypothetical protein